MCSLSGHARSTSPSADTRVRTELLVFRGVLAFLHHRSESAQNTKSIFKKNHSMQQYFSICKSKLNQSDEHIYRGKKNYNWGMSPENQVLILQSCILHCRCTALEDGRYKAVNGLDDLRSPGLECSNRRGQTQYCPSGWSGWNSQRRIR